MKRAGGAAALALVLAGCAPTAGLLDALQSNYQGYEELSPKLSPGRTGASFPYTPGTILPAVASVGEAGQRTWQATTDLHCDPGVTLKSLQFWQRRPYHFKAGSRSGVVAQAWLDDRTSLTAASLVGVSDVVVDVSNVRSYEPLPSVLADLNARANQGCVLPTGFGTIRRVRAVIVGNVRVRITFAQGVDLVARTHLSEQLSFALGFGFARISDNEIVGRNVAFGVKWQ